MAEGNKKAGKGARKLKSTGMRNGARNERKCKLYREREARGNTRKTRRIARTIAKGINVAGWTLTSKGKAIRFSK